MDQYADVFTRRGHLYDRAMRLFPTARDNEFLQLLKPLDLADYRRIYDIPAGGGYLAKFLDPGVDLTEFEPAAHFASDRARDVNLELLNLAPGQADLVISMAAMHHVANKPGFFAAAIEALRHGGCFCVGDAAAGSGVARFLDEFVGIHNGMGHSGAYLPADIAACQALAGPAARMERCNVAPCPWRFADLAAMTAFCRDLFGLQDVADAVLLEALDDFVGITRSDDGVQLEWELLYLQYRR